MNGALLALASSVALAAGWTLSLDPQARSGPAIGVAAQAASPAAPRTASGWPPRPDAIVHLASETASAPSVLLPQQLWSAYAVPSGMQLVITNAAILGEEMSLMGRRRGESEPSLRASPLDPGAPLGWVYPSGSQVVLRNEGIQALPLEYSMVGYLVPTR